MDCHHISSVAIRKAVSSFFLRNNIQCPENTEKYIVREAFGTLPYWAPHVRGSRFEDTIGNGILYRPEIVNAVCNEISQALTSEVRRGVMMKGPQGVGKSHSLVNTVLKLQSTSSYLVTFIPDCAWWNTASNLVSMICASFDSDPESLGFNLWEEVLPEALEKFIDVIDDELAALGKQWVFVFDQINKLFVKPMNRNAMDAAGLAFPFYYIKDVLKPKRITSVISASANNELAYKESHEGFQEYIHRTGMTVNELCLAFGSINETNAGQVMDTTGGVPLYSRMYAEDPDNFQEEINSSVLHSLDRLRELKLHDWRQIQESILSSIFGTKCGAEKYDKKFLVLEVSVADRTHKQYSPLFPAVLAAYRKHLWPEIMQYVDDKELHLLEVCRSPDTTNDTRGRIFEHIVIRRCQSLWR